MRKKLIVGNWKMYKNTHQASLLLHALADKVETHRDVEVVLCPNMLALQSLSLQVNRRQFKLGAQNCYWRNEGAFTGEVSAAMLRGIVDFVIVGHSERRHIFHETERDIRQKVQEVVRNGMQPILCVGETAREHGDGETLDVIRDQLVSGLANITSEEVASVSVAYEPVWSIGTGDVPKSKDIQAVARQVRQQITALYGKKAASSVRVLYGGSVDAHNADMFLSTPGIDGLLVGGASLRAEAFSAIVELAFDATRTVKKES